MDRRSYLVAVGGFTLGGLAGCVGAGQSEGDYDVGMSTRDFLPAVIAVPPGTTVTWKNTSGTGHTVTAYEAGIPDGTEYFASGDFDSQAAADSAWRQGGGGAVYAGELYEHTFERAGEYEYYCVPHEAAAMKGTVVVDEDATPLE